MNGLTNKFFSLSDPHRIQIFTMLTKKDMKVHELLGSFDLTQQAVSKHLAIMEKSGLISKTKIGRECICSINTEALDEIIDWSESFRKRWKKSLDRLDKYLINKNKGKR